MPRQKNTVERMLACKVDTSGDCWRWLGSVGPNGYGKAKSNGRFVLAHRAFYEHFKGQIPDGHQVDHLCKNRGCVNPNHLEAVTPAENNARSTSPSSLNAKKQTCIRGHLLDGANLYVTADGRRQCKECRAEATAKCWQAKVVKHQESWFA